MKYVFLYNMVLVIGFLIPLILAIIINEMVHAKSLFRLGIYFPSVVPGLAIVLMWGFIYRPGGTGVLNIMLGQVWYGSNGMA